MRSSGNWYKERTRLNSGNQQETFVQLNSELAMVVWNGIIETSMGSIRTPETPRPSKLAECKEKPNNFLFFLFSSFADVSKLVLGNQVKEVLISFSRF